jgi:hypothetical protein
VAGGLHSVVVQLLAAYRSAWCRSAIASVVRNNVEVRRLRQRQLVTTWPAADRDGLFNMAELTRCGTTLEDGAVDIFDLLARWR